MKKIVLMLIAAMAFAAGTATAKDYEVVKNVDKYEVKVLIDRNPPVTGKNRLSVLIKDEAGKNVKDAKVAVEYLMPAMPGMPPMKYSADAALKGDAYNATIDFTMKGPWSITVKFKRQDSTQKIKFSVDVN